MPTRILPKENSGASGGFLPKLFLLRLRHPNSKERVKFRIFIHKNYAHENCEKFWSKISGIPVSNFEKTIYKPTPHKLKKNLEYKGCVQIRVLRTEFFLEGDGLDTKTN